jgi:hypothetical protein
MARPLRPDIEAVWHHVINRGLERLRIFTEERTNLHFLGTLSILPVCLGLKIHAGRNISIIETLIPDSQIESGRGEWNNYRRGLVTVNGTANSAQC